jgi:hypothetical protein
LRPIADASDSDDFPGEAAIRVDLDLEVSDGSDTPPHSLSPPLAFEAVVPVAALSLSAPFVVEAPAGNGETIRACLATRVRSVHWLAHIEKVIEAEGAGHFVLLLLEPALSVEGVYVLRSPMREIRRVWGDTPEEISLDEPVGFWMYDGERDEFVEQEERAFSPWTDAVSM